MRPVNLIPAEERRGASRAPAGSTGNGVYFVLGGLALAVVAMLIVVMTGNRIKSQEAELAQLKSEKQAATEKAADSGVAPDAAFELAAQARYDAVRQKAVDRFNFARRLRQLTRALPDYAKMTKITGSLTASDSGGEASAASTDSATDPQMKLEMCVLAGQQSDVWKMIADVMTRLRNLDGVDKVTVDKTERQTDPATSGSAGSTGTTQGSGSAPGPCESVTLKPTLKIPLPFTLTVSFRGKDTSAAASGAAPQTATQQAQSAASTSNTANAAAGSDGAAPAGGSTP